MIRFALAAGMAVMMLFAEPQPPLTVEPSEVPVALAGGEAPVRFQLKNQSTKSIHAYVLVIGYYDDDGKLIGTLTTTGVSRDLLPRPDLRPPFGPGETWTHPYRMAEASGADRPARAVARVDFVLFDDGSSWGPDKAKMSLYLKGIKDGSRALAPQR